MNTAADPHAPTSNQRFGPLNSRRSAERIGFNRLLLASHAINMAVIVLSPALVIVLFALLKLVQWQWAIEAFHLQYFGFDKALEAMFMASTFGLLPHYVHTFIVHGFSKSANPKPSLGDVKLALSMDSVIPLDISLMCLIFILFNYSFGLPLVLLFSFLFSFLAGQLLRFKLMQRFLLLKDRKDKREPALFTFVKALYVICTVWTLSWIVGGLVASV